MTETMGNYDSHNDRLLAEQDARMNLYDRCEESAERVLCDWAKYNMPILKAMSDAVNHDMREAWANAGGEYSDCPGFEELNTVLQVLETLTAPKHVDTPEPTLSRFAANVLLNAACAMRDGVIR